MARQTNLKPDPRTTEVEEDEEVKMLRDVMRTLVREGKKCAVEDFQLPTVPVEEGQDKAADPQTATDEEDEVRILREVMRTLVREGEKCATENFQLPTSLVEEGQSKAGEKRPDRPEPESPRQSTPENIQSQDTAPLIPSLRDIMGILVECGRRSKEEEFQLPPEMMPTTPPASHGHRQEGQLGIAEQERQEHGQEEFQPFAALVRAARMLPQEDFELPDIENLRRGRAKKNGNRKTILHILQLNANGIGSADKRAEILRYTEEHGVDVICLQETNLRRDQDTPTFEGWEVAGRADRRQHRGQHGGETHGYGGVLTLVRRGSSISFEPAAFDIKDRNSDAVMTIIHTAERKVNLLNAYIATVKNSDDDMRRDEFNPESLPNGRNTLIAADVNAHTELWDNYRVRDTRGARLAEWMDQPDMCALNTGEPTRHDSSGRGTSPDVTICHAAWVGSVDWRVGEDLTSDHRPLHIMVEIQARNAPPRRRKARLCFRKANWDLYRSLTDQKFKTKLRHMKSTETAAKRITRIMVQAAEKAIPRAPPRRNAKAWWCEEAEEAVKQRRKARETLRRNPGNEDLMAECNEKTTEAKKIIKQAKLKAWAQECEKMDAATDSTQLYATIRAMDGRGRNQESAAVLKAGSKTAKTRKEKANILVKHYAKVSQAQYSKATKMQKEHLKARRRAVDKASEGRCAEHPRCRGRACRPYSMTELEAALSNMKSGAAGPDGVTPQMLKELSETGKKTLLRVLNKSLLSGQVPTAWRRANIIPIHKKGKPPEQPASYRPISLTSCICKLAERLLQSRLAYLLEVNDVLVPEQAGFRAGRCTEEQIARLGQDIMDALEAKPTEKTVMVAVDMSAAYDRVHRPSLLYKMMDLDVPPCMIRWIKSLLADRRARVLWEETASNEMKVREGLPQGGVLSPLLWLCYSNDLAYVLRRHEVQIGMYADDLIIYASDRCIPNAQAKVQAAMDEIDEWADTWSMSISTTKTKSILFTSNVNEVNSKRKVELCLGESVIEQVSEITVLGVVFDTQLSFTQHVKQLKSKLAKRLQVTKALAGTTWGCGSATLRRTYCQFIQPVALYGSSTYMPLSHKTNREKVDQVAAAGARVITGCPAGTRTRVAMAEANIRSISSLADEQGAILRERVLRLPGSVPARKTVTRKVKKRLKNRQSWREEATKTATEAQLEETGREPNTLPTRPPWLSTGKGRVSFHTEAGDTTSRADTPDTRRAAAGRVLDSLPPADCIYFTDGSTEEGFGVGGGGIVREEQSRGNATWSVPAGRWTSSYRAEQVAFLAAIEDAGRAPRTVKTVRICTDSLSLVMFLRRGAGSRSPDTLTRIWHGLQKLTQQRRKVQVVWIPGHADITGNEQADQAANTGRSLPQQEVKVDLPSAKAAIRGVCRKKWSGTYHTTVPPEHTHRRATEGRCLKYEKEWSRRDQVLLHQLRTNRCPLLQATLHRWNRPDTDGLCSECGVAEDTEHVICDCPKYQTARSALLGHIPALTVLQSDPDAVLRFMRRTGLLPEAR